MGGPAVNKKQDDIILCQFRELELAYPELDLKKTPKGSWIIEGILRFKSNLNGAPFKSAFKIRLIIPPNYPEMYPWVWEIGDRIPEDYEHLFTNKSFCLGARIVVYKKFASDRRLLPFVRNQVVEFLSQFCYLMEYGKLPWGELSHRYGTLAHYQEFFSITETRKVLGMLKFLADNRRKNKFDGRIHCPCESGKRIKSCHDVQLREDALCPNHIFRNDIYTILKGLNDDDRRDVIGNSKVIPREYALKLEEEFRIKTDAVKGDKKKGEQLSFNFP